MDFTSKKIGLIIGKRATGKTEFCKNILQSFVNTHQIHIFTHRITLHQYLHFRAILHLPDYTNEIIKDLLLDHLLTNDLSRKLCLVFDDNTINNKTMNLLFKASDNHDVNIIFVSQFVNSYDRRTFDFFACH